MAYITAVSQLPSSVTVRLAGLDTDYADTDRYIDWMLDGHDAGESYLGANVSEGGDITFCGLCADTAYAVEAVITYGAGRYTASPAPLTVRTRTEYFSWHTPKNTGEVFLLTAAEWNALTDNIGAQRRRRGEPEAGLERAVSGGTLTAGIYNAAAVEINSMQNVYSLPAAVTGDRITAGSLNAMAAALNSIA